MELFGFIKLSMLYLLLHMELSLCMTFYLRHNLGGYMVNTTRFPVKIEEALAP
jgi:hypothetical protein